MQAKGNAQATLPQKVHGILKANCYRCHGEDGENEGGLNYVLDLKSLVARNKVVPGNPNKSVLYGRVTSDKRPMPPKSEQVRPSAADIALLRQWIEAGAAAIDLGEAARDFFADADVIRFIRDDLRKIETRDRRFARYFTITHLYNAGRSDDELQTYRHGLSKLVNSLSWERDIKVPQPVDPARTVLRIDLRDYQWSPELWQRILGDYPYGLVPSTATAREVLAATECEQPWVRADWFVFAASRPPLYHEVLQLPKTDRELEQKLIVDAGANIRQEKIARAGFNSSGVSTNNRLIERHRSSYGAYWKSYDFAHNRDRKNLFAHPLGPGDDASAFQHDGGEIIFNLPNGLQGYLLTDHRGARIDKGPTTIVRDDRQPDRAVVNGVSCMACHAHGMIDKADQVRAHVQKNAGSFAPDVVATILAIYPPREKFAALVQEDADRFAAAVKKTGAHLSMTEPIAALARRYDQELDLLLASAEAGLRPEAFRKGLEASPDLARALGTLNTPGGTVQRDTFDSAFRDIARQLLGDHPGLLASASFDGTIKLWDVLNGKELRTLRGHTDAVRCVAFSADGLVLASASQDKSVKLWDARTGQETRTLHGHTDAIRCVAIAADGQVLASASDDKTIKLWDMRTGKELHTLAAHTDSIASVAFAANSQVLASASDDKTIKLWDTRTGKELRTLRGHTGFVVSVTFAPDGQELASASWDKTVKLWDALTGQELRVLRRHTDAVASVAFTANGLLLASASADNTAKLWEARTGEELRTLRGHTNGVTSISFAANSQLLATAGGSPENTVKIWDARTGKELCILRGHTNWVTSLAFTADRKVP